MHVYMYVHTYVCKYFCKPFPQTVNVAGDNTTQQSVPSKPVEKSYAVTDVVNVPSKDKKNDKKVRI